jgi:hypothetical protein
MLDCLPDNIFILLGLFADLFLHVYEAFCLQGLLKNKNRKLVHTCISSFRCIDDVLPLNNSRLGDYLHRIYPTELKLTYGNDSQMHSYLDLHIEIDNEGRLKTQLYDKHNDVTFPIVNFPFIKSNIPASSAHGAYAPQLIRYCRAVPRTVTFWREHSH